MNTKTSMPAGQDKPRVLNVFENVPKWGGDDDLWQLTVFFKRNQLIPTELLDSKEFKEGILEDRRCRPDGKFAFFTLSEFIYKCQYRKDHKLDIPFIDIGHWKMQKGQYIILTYDFTMKKFYFRLDGYKYFEIKNHREQFYSGVLLDDEGDFEGQTTPEFDAKKLDPKYLFELSDVWKIIHDEQYMNTLKDIVIFPPKHLVYSHQEKNPFEKSTKKKKFYKREPFCSWT